jgi:extradiol dioxygenase family protein
VRSAVARFGQVRGVTDDERAAAFENIRAAARHYGVALHVDDWHDIVHARGREIIG